MANQLVRIIEAPPIQTPVEKVILGSHGYPCISFYRAGGRLYVRMDRGDTAIEGFSLTAEDEAMFVDGLRRLGAIR